MEAFTVQNWKLKVFNHPIEDSFGLDFRNKIMAVADGVTRDPSEKLPNRLSWMLKYPKQSHARAAADIFTIYATDYLKKTEENGETAIKKAFEDANARIAKYNLSHRLSPTDYLVNDLAGCTAALTVIDREVFHYGFICDCGIALFDRNGNLRFQTKSEGPEECDPYLKDSSEVKGKNWKDPVVRRLMRSKFRNNMVKQPSYGVLTGESQALVYVRTGTLNLREGDYLIAHTDGLEPLLHKGKFVDKLRAEDWQGLQNFCRKNVYSEGTLVCQRYH